MRNLYLVWHGTTLFSSLRRCEGWSDSPLTDEARAQARACGTGYFAARGIRPAACFSSMAERACDTLELVWEAAFGEVPHYTRLKGLKDLNYGIYEGKEAALLPDAPYGDFFCRFDGESDEQAAARLQETLVSLPCADDVASALVSTHQLVCTLLCARLGEGLAQRVAAAPAGSVLHLSCDQAMHELAFVDLYQPEA